MRRTPALILAAALLLGAAACSDDDDGSAATTTASADAPTTTAAAPDDTTDAAPDGTTDEGSGDPGEMSTGGLIDFLEAEYPDTEFAGEVSLLSTGDGSIRLGTQTSFFEADEAVAYCEAVAEYVYVVAGAPVSSSLELISTNGNELATRASGEDPCEAGADV